MAELILDNKTYQAYVSIAEQNNISVTDAFKEALLLLKQHFRKSPRSSVRQRLEERIGELRALSSNWDNAGSPAISASACDMAKKVVEACDDALLQGLAIFPNTNGYVLMQWKTRKGDACLSILGDRMVCYINYRDQEKEGVLALSEITGFINELKHIA